MQNDNIAITRSHLGQLASIIGGTALLMGIIGWIWQGSLSDIIIAALGIGLVGIVLWAALTPHEFRAFISGRQARYGTSAVFGTLLLLGIVALFYVVLQRAVIVMDMTEGQRFSISEETRNILRQVSTPIRITGFYSPRMLAQREIDDQFFRLYEIATDGKISRNYIDPDEQPAQAERYGLTYDGEVFLSFLNADGSVDFTSLSALPRSESQERDITEAISRLLISGTLTVYFDQSHEERDPLSAEPQGMSGINNGIQASGLITFPISLIDLAAVGGNIPDDASALILARPTTDFSEAEIAVIDRYLRKGGGLFIMSDVLFNENAFLRQDGLFSRYLWENFGIRALDAAVVDEVSHGQTLLESVSAAVYPENDIARRLDEENAPTLFRITRPLEVIQSASADVLNGKVITSSTQSYGETNLQLLGETETYRYDQDADIPGPLTTVAWAYNRTTGAKIVLTGDSDFATNSLVDTSGNAILFTDSLSWLTGFSDQVTFSPQAYGTGSPVIFVDGQMLDLIAFVTVILMPGVVFAIGLILWVRRMRA
ncbi:MAG: GldG family protein [Chloroflexi bacterium]|nr:GldG family protein [Chloroflexota bacterium]MCC6895636.1 GldG family protein [Anaerolineae bacterium]